MLLVVQTTRLFWLSPSIKSSSSFNLLEVKSDYNVHMHAVVNFTHVRTLHSFFQFLSLRTTMDYKLQLFPFRIVSLTFHIKANLDQTVGGQWTSKFYTDLLRSSIIFNYFVGGDD